MNWISWNYTRIGILALAQGALVTILLHPWLQMAAVHWKFSVLVAMLWVFATTLSCIVTAKQIVSKGREGLPYLALVLGLAIILALILRLTLLLFIPLTLVLFYVGVRFGDYPKRARFGFDWACGSMFLVITSSLEGLLGLEVPISSMLLFFSLGIASMILWNATALEMAGLQPDYRGLGRSIAIFIAVVGGVSLVLGMVLSPSFFHSFVGVLHRTYLFIADVVFFVLVRPFAWLMTPLFRWVENLELQELSIELPGGELAERDRLSRIDNPLSAEAMERITWVSWIVFVVVLSAAVWIMVRRLLRRPTDDQPNLMQETRESVFSGREALRDLRAALQGMLKPLTRLSPGRWYKGDDPLLRIRTIYARFVVKERKRVPIHPGSTPREYANTLSEADEELDQAAVQTITTLYNNARYGEVGDQEAVSGMDEAFRKI